MNDIYWRTDKPHFNNTETMNDYLDNENMLDITLVDGAYAEGVNGKGEKYAIHASGDGDSFSHRITFKRIVD